jgi:ribokinase
VAIVGRVGDDDHGRGLIDGLRREGVDVSSVGIDERVGTGLALITIDPSGENTIVGSSAANMELTPDLVRASAEKISKALVVVAQLEVPTATVAEAAGLTRGTFVLNPAPARPLPSELLAHVDVLVPNRSELGLLAGYDEPTDEEEVLAAVAALAFDGVVVVTLGDEGALLIEAGDVTRHPAVPADAVDATGAGDAFCGALVFGMSQGWDLKTAVPFAVAAGSVAVTRLGAQSAMPTRDEVEAALGR